MKETVIKRNKIRLIVYLFASIVFTLFCIHMVINPSRSFEKVMGIIGIIFLLLYEILVFTELISKKELLIINEKGFISCLYSFGLIPWENVDLIYTAYKYSIYIDVNNMQELLTTAPKFQKKSNKFFKTKTLYILLHSKKQQEEAFKVLMDYYDTYRKRQEALKSI